MTTLLPEEVDGLHAAAAHLVRERGLTHRGEDPWKLDPLPLVLQARDWHPLEAGLQQRAELLNAVLADLGGTRRLLASGLLPAEILVTSPALIRAALGIEIPGSHQLFMLSTDVVRNADGAWTAIADHTGVPVGLGYAMEDRRVVAQVMAGQYRQLHVRRLGPFFSAMRASLIAVAPPGPDSPRMAVLTPGAEAPGAFDHAHLATMLGVPLVEGRDLVVEDGRLWSRTLEGKEPLDVVVRRVGARTIDPLEQPGRSRSGIPGILHAAREGTVSVVNTFNSGVLSAPALAAFLPRLARHLLGDELLLPSVATYWGGDRNMCSHVIAHVGRLVLRSTRGGRAVDARRLTLAQRADLCARISAEPWAWVGQEPVEPSQAETLTATGLERQPCGLRTFTVSRGDSWAVMPGALAQVGDVQAEQVRATKDLWIIAVESPAEEEPQVRGGPARSVVSPRVAEALHRLGRDLERAEQTTRLLRAVADVWDDYHHRFDAGAGAPPGTEALDLLLGALRARTGSAGSLAQLVLGPEEGSIASCVRRAEECALEVRDLLSPEGWPAFAAIDGELGAVRRQYEGADAPAQLGLAPPLSRILAALLTLGGIVSDSMVRDEGWQLLEAGRRLERAEGVVGTLAALHVRTHPAAVQRLLIEASLAAHDSLVPHRRRFGAGDLTGLWQLLLADATNPRSVAFQVDRIERALAALPGRTQTSTALVQDLADLLAEAPRVWDVVDADGRRVRIAEHLDSMAWRLQALSDDLSARWFFRPGDATWAAGGQQE